MRSFLQTKEWLDFQKHLGRATWRFDNGKIAANIVAHKLPLGRNYLYIPHGPVLNFDNFDSGVRNEIDNFLAYLKDLAREERSMFVKIEPLSDSVMELIFRKRMKRSGSVQPQRTVILNLELSEEELLSRMHHKTRYNIKVAEKYGIIVKDSNDIDEFWKLLKKTAKRDRFSSHPKDYYKKLLEYFGGDGMKVELAMAYHNDKAVAGALLMTHGDTCYYLHGASDHDARSMMAPYALHWENIKYLKARGVKYYDLWGIDARRWPGVTRFKLGWGGRQVEYPGSFDIPVSSIWYLIYRIARKIF